MSSITGKGGVSGAVSAGDFQATIGLYPNNFNPKNKLDGRNITNFVTEFEISEGLNQTSLLAKLTVRDGVNLLEDMRITGSEKISIQVAQEEPGENGKMNKFYHLFHISDVYNYSRKLGIQTYNLQLVSRTAYLNQLEIKNNSFNGAIGDEVKKTLSELMGNDELNHQNVFINSGGGNIKGCYPHLRPIDSIKWLKRNAFDEGTPYYFFESLNYNEGDEKKRGGLVFESYKGFLKNFTDQYVADKGIADEVSYSMVPYGHGQDQGEKQFKASKRILGMSTTLGMSKFNQIPKGAYGSELTTVDIATKTVKQKPYEYKDEDQLSLRLGGKMYKPFATTEDSKFNDRTLDEYQGRRLYSSINTLGMEDKKNYHSNLEDESDQLQKSLSIESNLNYIQHEIDLYSDFNLYPGSIIFIAIPKSADPTSFEGKEPRDMLQSGIYLVTRITHIFKNNEYKMKVTIGKDRSMLDLDSVTPPPQE